MMTKRRVTGKLATTAALKKLQQERDSLRDALSCIVILTNVEGGAPAQVKTLPSIRDIAEKALAGTWEA